MGVRGLARAVLVGTVAVAVGSLPAAAQNVTFSTTGTLTGGTCASNSCTVGAFTLTFVNAGSNLYGAPTNVDLGSFSTTCAGCVASGASVSSTFTGLTFTLQINQTIPSVGAGSYTGTVSGTIGWNPITSTLVWTPTTSVVQIGGVTYALIIDNTGNIVINAPTTDQTPNLTAVKAHISAVPEPSTVALMATGLFGLIPVVRRRRS